MSYKINFAGIAPAARLFRTLIRPAGILLGASGLLIATIPGASALDSSWAIQSTPSGNSDPLSGISCVSATYCVAVDGDDSTYGALSWNGETWTQIPYPSDAERLTSIACTSVGNCIAVGQTDTRLAGSWAWNAGVWTDQTTYNPTSTDNVLDSVTCKSSTSCEAVGAYGNGDTTYPLAEVWNGTAWESQATTGAPPGSLAGVSCESVTKCEAVGYNSFKIEILTMKLNGSKWATQSNPSPEGYYANGISCWSSGCTAVGSSDGTDDFNDAAYLNTIAEYWNGSKWALQGAAGAGNPADSGAEWNAVKCNSATKCTAVGAWADPDINETPATLASSWNGTTWTQQSTPNPGTGTNALTGIACFNGGSGCEAVGWAAPNTLALKN